MPSDIDQLIDLYSLTDEKFEEYKKIALITLTSGKRPANKDKKIIIVGGQAGAGKTRLIPLAKEELENNAVVVDFDELRALHPNYREVSESHPKITHRILHRDTERVKNEILDELIRKEYNVIYEGALRNTQGFVDFSKKFQEAGYKIKCYIMAVPKLESYGSTFYRYANALMQEETPRWVEKDAHDGSYEGVIRTVETFISEGITDDIQVYVRDVDRPKLIYTKDGKQHKSAIEAINYGRESGRRKAINNFQTKYNMVNGIFKEKSPELCTKLNDWIELFEEEREYFDRLDRLGSDYSD